MQKISETNKQQLEAFLLSITGQDIKGRDLDSVINTIEAIINKRSENSFIVPMFGLTCNSCKKQLESYDGSIFYTDECYTLEAAEESDWERIEDKDKKDVYKCIDCICNESEPTIIQKLKPNDICIVIGRALAMPDEEIYSSAAIGEKVKVLRNLPCDVVLVEFEYSKYETVELSYFAKDLKLIE